MIRVYLSGKFHTRFHRTGLMTHLSLDVFCGHWLAGNVCKVCCPDPPKSYSKSLELLQEIFGNDLTATPP